MKKSFINYFNSDYYILLIYLLSLLNWFGIINYLIYFPILTVIIVMYCFTCRDSKGIIPIVLSLLIANVFAFEKGSYDVAEIMKNLNYPLIISCACIAFISFLYFYLKNREIHGRFSILGLSLLIIFISFTLSDIFKSKTIDFINVGIVFLLFYFFKHTTNYYKMKEDFLPYFSKVFYYFGLTIAIEMFGYYAMNFTLDLPNNFAPNLGWAQHNCVSLLLMLGMSIGAYILHYTRNTKYFLGLLVMATANILTTSRGGILAMGVLIIFLLIIFGRKYYSRKDFFKGFIITCIFFLTLFLIFTPYFKKILELLFNDGFNNNGRFELWKKAIDAFKNNPILGAGSFIFPSGGNLWRPWFHSTFFDTLGQLGLVGLGAFGFHFIVKYLSLLKNRSTFKWFVLAGFIATGLHGLIDVTYFSFQYLIIYTIICSTIEYSSGYISYKRND